MADSASLTVTVGHVHEEAVQMDLFLNDKYICSSKAKYGSAVGQVDKNGNPWESIKEVTTCSGPIHVKSGDCLSMTAEYDLTKHPM